VLDPLAKMVIAGEIRDGQMVKVDTAGENGGGIKFSAK